MDSQSIFDPYPPTLCFSLHARTRFRRFTDRFSNHSHFSKALEFNTVAPWAPFPNAVIAICQRVSYVPLIEIWLTLFFTFPKYFQLRTRSTGAHLGGDNVLTSYSLIVRTFTPVSPGHFAIDAS